MQFFVIFTILTVTAGMSSSAYAEEDEHAWFFTDFEARIAEVNEGELEILPQAPDPLPHHHDDHLVVDADSLKTAWARLRQCHYQMDEISRAEVVYLGDPVRNLRVLSSHGIEQAWVENNSLQLKGVSKGAELCIRTEQKAVHKKPGGGYQVRMGPFMRRFLDGYYPLGVNLTVDFPCEQLRLVSIWPNEQSGVQIERQACSVKLHAWFKGKMQLIMDLEEIRKSN